jgi:hypothetical protein
MKFGISCGATLLLAAVLSPAVAADPVTTSRASFVRASAAAKSWQADAVLTSVSTMAATPDGKSASWSHLFYSANAKKGYIVDVAGNKVLDTLEVRAHVTDPVALDFIDSDKAMSAAKANGVDTKGKPYSMTLRVMGQNTKRPGTLWLVGGGFASGAVAVAVDARSGKFSFRQGVP